MKSYPDFYSPNNPSLRLGLYSDTPTAGKLHFLVVFRFCFLVVFKFISRAENNHMSSLEADSWIRGVTWNFWGLSPQMPDAP
jgi:hypothetical protein